MGDIRAVVCGGPRRGVEVVYSLTLSLTHPVTVGKGWEIGSIASTVGAGRLRLGRVHGA